jgi:integrase/recombinase XerD
LRDVQYLAGHTSLQTTERYIEYSAKARRSIVDII